MCDILEQARLLWDHRALQQDDWAGEETLPAQGDGVTRITKVANPSIIVFRPENASGPTPGVLVCPSGGLDYLVFSKHGTDIAKWLNGLGITAVVLKYTVPDKSGKLAFRDAQRAMSMFRHNCGQWNVDPDNIGVIGFSAGGYLAAMLSTNFDKRAYEPIDEVDDVSSRPDFAMMLFPWGLTDQDGKLNEQFAVKPSSPETLLIHAQDDQAAPDVNSLSYCMALKDAGVSSEMHLYPTGGHGFGLEIEGHGIADWPLICQKWLKQNGVIKNFD